MSMPAACRHGILRTRDRRKSQAEQQKEPRNRASMVIGRPLRSRLPPWIDGPDAQPTAVCEKVSHPRPLAWLWEHWGTPGACAAARSRTLILRYAVSMRIPFITAATLLTAGRSGTLQSRRFGWHPADRAYTEAVTPFASSAGGHDPGSSRAARTAARLAQCAPAA
jgi:hypothetical protein